jgi:hypothetical protein
VEEATPEIVRGVSSHYELEGRIPVRRWRGRCAGRCDRYREDRRSYSGEDAAIYRSWCSTQKPTEADKRLVAGSTGSADRLTRMVGPGKDMSMDGTIEGARSNSAS